MIVATLKRFGAWIRDTGWPSLTGAYSAHEGVRQFFTFAFGVFLGWLVS